MNPRIAFFDGIADRWDSWNDLAKLSRQLDEGVTEFGLQEDEVVLDIGCGTGNLTASLLKRLSAQGRVHAVDISPRMLEVARGKIPDPRVTWHVASAVDLPLAPSSCDRAICFSVWPHFDDATAVARSLFRVLKPGGSLHVWHVIPRQKVNEIHASAGPAVRQDVLEPAQHTAEVLGRNGFRIVVTLDARDRYLVTATRLAGVASPE